MIIKPFLFNSSTAGLKKLINNIESLNCDIKDITIAMEATGLLFENLIKLLNIGKWLQWSMLKMILIRALQEQIKSLEDEMVRIFDKPIDSNEVSKKDGDYISSVLDNLRTIPGVSDKTLLVLLVECGNLDRFKDANL